MKKRLTIALIAIFSALVIFLIVFLVFGILRGGKYGYRFSTNVVFEESYRENEIENFDVFISCGDVRFSESVGSKIHVKVFSDKKDNLSVKQNDKTLNINLSRRKHIINIFPFGFIKYKDGIMVSVPKSFDGKISVKSNFGDIFADDMNDASVDIQSDLGTVSLGKIKDAKITSHLGDVKIDEVLNWLDIESSLGDVEIKSVSLNKDSKIKSALGDVRIEKTKGVYVDADVALGDKRIKGNDKSENVTLWIDSALGDVVVN